MWYLALCWAASASMNISYSSAGAGATVPLTGFGYSLAKGVKEAVAADGIIGAFTGGVVHAAGGITAAIVFGLLAALLFHPKDKS